MYLFYLRTLYNNRMLPLLQELNNFINRCGDVVQNMIHQLGEFVRSRHTARIYLRNIFVLFELLLFFNCLYIYSPPFSLFSVLIDHCFFTCFCLCLTASLYHSRQKLYQTTFKDVHLTPAWEAIGTLLTILITIDNIVLDNVALEVHWTKVICWF